ncbi:MAG TPA: amino acid adenylation domain-containing protein, partial [Streptosporangiaceae bacterium]
MINGYGPAEATIGVIYKDCTGEMRSPPPIGRPVGNHRAYLLGPDLRPVPFGAIGELYLAGAGLAWGYLGNPALTAERFLPCPFTGGGGRMLRTGDLARFNADGDLVFAGRRDRQVKVRGQRVELGEIEAALASSDGIRAAVVDAGPGVPAGPDGRQDAPVTLTAYLVLAGDTTPDMRRLRADLSARLPGYMLPNRFAVVSEIPANANGKVDIAALRSVGRAAPADPAAADPAAAGLTAAQERVYARCVAPVMPSAAPAPEADFFQMGGTSLEVMRLAARAYQAFGVEVPVAEFLRRPTLATLTRLIERGRPPQSRDGPRRAGYDGGPLPETLRTVPQPLSPGQRGIWFADRLAPGAAAYNIIEAYRLRGELDPRALRESLRALTERHEALRSRIVEHDGVPCQIVDPAPGEFRLDHRSMPGAAIEQVADLLASLLSEPFDLTVQHPLRAVLVSMGKADHVLALIMHHIFSDGRSTEVLLEELSGLCAGFRGGTAAPLPPRPAQPAQFAAWQDARLRAGAAVRELPYWREQLAGIPLEAELPARRPRPAAQARRGSTLYFSLPPETGGRVASVGRQVGATPFMTLLAGFAALLARYGRSRDIVVGTPVSSRSRVDFDRLVSFACNMVVLRVPCRGDPTFRELLGMVRTTTLEAYAHREVPFERLVDQLAPERDPRRNPLFQVTFQAFDAPGDFLRLPGCQAEKIKVPESSCRFDLSLAVQIHRSGLLDGYLNYSTDLFGRATAQRVVDHYRTLLCEALADPDRPLSVLAMLTKAERDALLAHAHGPRVDAEASVTELVERQTARTPSAPAVSQGEDRLSYAQLNAAANRVAHLLVRHGVRRGDVVGVCMERSPALVIALLGILKAGAAYLPADPAAPERRVAFMFGEAGAAVAVTEQGLAARLPPATHRILLDDPGRSLAAMPDSSPGIAAGPDDLAYVMYTSGSTGLPKGVTVPHRAIARLVRGLPLGPIGPADTFLLLAPVAFDASTFEIWTPLAHGARLAVCPGGPVGPRELGQVLRRERVSVLWLTAQFTNLVVNTAPAELGALATLVAGGEALSAPHIGRLLRELPDLAVYNGYGPTECTTFAVMHRVQAAHTKNAAPVPIGAPIGGTTAHVLGADLNPVPIGSVGELYLGGDGLALSYLNRPGQTAERFIPDPFGHPGGRLYRTGDLVTRLPGGELTFRGRVDDQIKLRGFRIEPGEVAAVLSGHPAVADSFVTTRGRGIDTELVAYAQTREPCDAETLRAYLSDRLPGYMVPTSIVLVDTLPLSPNGKVDRSALPDARAAARAGNLLARGSAPAGGLQTLIAEVWAEVLGHRDIGAFDNFFRLGGNSLQATQVIARLAARLGHEAPLTTMFRHPTVAGLAAALRDAGHPSDGPPATPPGEPPPGGPAPLTPGQQGLWFLEQLYPGQPAYNVAFGLRLSGPLDHQALACALKRIVERHAVLRSRFLLGLDGWPVQVSEPAGCFELTIDDVPGLGEDDAIERLRSDAAQPFSLATAPLA